MPMQPSPMADTSRLLFPSVRLFMRGPFMVAQHSGDPPGSLAGGANLLAKYARSCVCARADAAPFSAIATLSAVIEAARASGRRQCISSKSLKYSALRFLLGPAQSAVRKRAWTITHGEESRLTCNLLVACFRRDHR